MAEGKNTPKINTKGIDNFRHLTREPPLLTDTLGEWLDAVERWSAKALSSYATKYRDKDQLMREALDTGIPADIHVLAECLNLVDRIRSQMKVLDVVPTALGAGQLATLTAQLAQEMSVGYERLWRDYHEGTARGGRKGGGNRYDRDKILALAEKGLSNRNIAHRVGCSESTVRRARKGN
jgi:hypothetical protein